MAKTNLLRRHKQGREVIALRECIKNKCGGGGVIALKKETDKHINEHLKSQERGHRKEVRVRAKSESTGDKRESKRKASERRTSETKRMSIKTNERKASDRKMSVTKPNERGTEQTKNEREQNENK